MNNTTNDTTLIPIVYGAAWCAFCHTAMEYMDKLGVKYEYRDVESKDDWMKEALDKSGQTGIPVIDIAGDVIVGFDRPKIESSLKAHKLVA